VQPSLITELLLNDGAAPQRRSRALLKGHHLNLPLWCSFKSQAWSACEFNASFTFPFLRPVINIWPFLRPFYGTWSSWSLNISESLIRMLRSGTLDVPGVMLFGGNIIVIHLPQTNLSTEVGFFSGHFNYFHMNSTHCIFAKMNYPLAFKNTISYLRSVSFCIIISSNTKWYWIKMLVSLVYNHTHLRRQQNVPFKAMHRSECKINKTTSSHDENMDSSYVLFTAGHGELGMWAEFSPWKRFQEFLKTETGFLLQIVFWPPKANSC